MPFPRRSYSLAALAALCFLACGGQSSSDAHGGASSTGGSASGGRTGGLGGSGGAGNASGGVSSGGTSCDPSAFADDAGWSVTVIIANQSSRTLHLGQATVTCGVSPLFRVRDAAGSALAELGDCRQPCQNVLEGRGGIGCTGLCRFPNTVTLAPDESTSLIWDGRFRTDDTVPAACLPSGQNSEPVVCDRAQQVDSGVFRFIASAGTAVDCSSTSGSCGACEVNSLGGCTTWGALISGTMLSAETTVALDASYGVGPNGSGSDGQTVPVEIIFKD